MGRLPKGWLGCPANGRSLIADIFMPMKTPLDSKYRSTLNPEDEYAPQEIFRRAKNNKVKIKLWIDLTNTNRYYNREEVEYENCQFVKLSCPGHGSCPSKAVTDAFISICEKFHKANPHDCVVVHCTHGFNRTGFLIVAYLVEKLKYSVDVAIKAFQSSRPPGIYRQNYVEELFRRYGDISKVPRPLRLPDWCDCRH